MPAGMKKLLGGALLFVTVLYASIQAVSQTGPLDAMVGFSEAAQ